jgi:hypothetical protein
MFWFIVGAGLTLALLGIAHAYNFSLSVGGANKVSTSWESDEPLEVNYDDTLAIGADVAIGIALDISQIRALVIVASTAATIFAGDVTEMYVTNVAACRLQIYTSQAS